MLLRAGADVNAQGGVYGNALCAARYGRQKDTGIVEILLEAGAQDISTAGARSKS